MSNFKKGIIMRIIPRRKVEISLKEIYAIWRSIFLHDNPINSKVLTFEKAFAHFIGVKYALVVPSARVGLAVLLDALEFHPGDKIILSSYNYHVIPALIKLKGLTPVFVDIDPLTWNIDVSLIERSITPKTKAIIATHLFGQACDLEEILDICKKYNLILIEDVAHACGAEYKNIKLGNFGDVAYFSFGTGKALVAFGGGMLVTNSDFLFEKIQNNLNKFKFLYNRYSPKAINKILAEFIGTTRIFFSLFVYPIIAFTNLIGSDFVDRLIEDKYVLEDGRIGKKIARFSEIQAAVGLEQLARLKILNKKRSNYAHILTGLLKDIDDLKTPSVGKDRTHISLYYCIVTNQAKALRKYLALRGVDTKRGSMRACSSLKFFDSQSRCTIAEKISDNVIELPCYPSLTKKDIYYQANLIRRFFKKSKN